MNMPRDTGAQPVLSPLTAAAVFLVLEITPGGEPAARGMLGDLAALVRSVGFRAPDAGLTCVAGVGSRVWDRLFAGPRPPGLHPFREVAGARHRAVATPGDLLLHIRAERMDVCFELAALIVGALGGSARVRDEVHGFRYFDERDLIGFVDGTENPTGQEAVAAALVAGGDPLFAGGSYALVQKYVHDMAAWNALTVEDQERAVGRTKLSDVELGDDVKPANSHVALTTVTGPDGVQRQIFRANMPFGTVGKGEFGTYFIGYSADPGVTEEMLERMFVGDPPGNHDRILDFATAVTGGLFFVPPAGFLAHLPGQAPAGARAQGEPVTGDPAAGSLRIGGLKRSAPL